MPWQLWWLRHLTPEDELFSREERSIYSRTQQECYSRFHLLSHPPHLLSPSLSPLSLSPLPLFLFPSLTHKPEPFSTHQKGLTAFVWALPLGNGALCTPACSCQRTTVEKGTETNKNQTSSVAMFPGVPASSFWLLTLHYSMLKTNKQKNNNNNWKQEAGKDWELRYVIQLQWNFSSC